MVWGNRVEANGQGACLKKSPLERGHCCLGILASTSNSSPFPPIIKPSPCWCCYWCLFVFVLSGSPGCWPELFHTALFSAGHIGKGGPLHPMQTPMIKTAHNAALLIIARVAPNKHWGAWLSSSGVWRVVCCFSIGSSKLGAGNCWGQPEFYIGEPLLRGRRLTL